LFRTVQSKISLKRFRLGGQLEVPEGVHSHKVNVKGDVMLINYERYQNEQQVQ